MNNVHISQNISRKPQLTYGWKSLHTVMHSRVNLASWCLKPVLTILCPARGLNTIGKYWTNVCTVLYVFVRVQKFAISFLTHCKDTILKIWNKYSQKRNFAASEQFPHSCVCERFIYSHDRPAYSAAGKYVDWSWKYINRSQAHECGNWDWGRAIPFLGIHKWDFSCSTTSSPLKVSQLIFFITETPYCRVST